MGTSNGKKVLISVSSFAEADDLPARRLHSGGLHAVPNPYGRRITKQELLTLLSDDVAGLIAGLEPLDREVLEQSHLKVISRVGSGVSNVDLDAAADLGIVVRSTPEAPVSAVAELTLGAALALLRAIPQMDSALHGGAWERLLGGQLEGKTVAIFGFGRIGRRVAELMTSFGARVVAVDPYLKASETSDVPLFPLEEALPLADLITLHASGEECILDERAFSLMKDGVFVLNAARGDLISEAALIRALDSGKVAGAWLDVFSDEPYSGPLCGYANVLLTPHAASHTRECRVRMEMEAVENLIESLNGS